MKQTANNQCVKLNTEIIKPKDVVEITYKGILAQSGAEAVYIHCGSSDIKNWKDIQDVKMTKNSDNTFSASILIQEGTTFNMCFRDSANNWDNNSGSNYSLVIED